MIHCFVSRFRVVDVNAWNAKAWTEFASIDYGSAARCHCPDQGRDFLRKTMAEENESVSFFALQHLCVTSFALHVVLRVADEYRVALAQCRVFDALKDQRKKWI